MDSDIQIADNRLLYLTMNEEELDTYFRIQKAEMDRRAELHYALKKGKTKIAKKMLAKGLTPESISEITELSLEEIAKLQP